MTTHKCRENIEQPKWKSTCKNPEDENTSIKMDLIITHVEDDIPILFMVGKRDNQLFYADANLQT